MSLMRIDGRGEISDKVCVELGAAPGGWTMVLLENEARVYSVDWCVPIRRCSGISDESDVRFLVAGLTFRTHTFRAIQCIFTFEETLVRFKRFFLDFTSRVAEGLANFPARQESWTRPSWLRQPPHTRVR